MIQRSDKQYESIGHCELYDSLFSIPLFLVHISLVYTPVDPFDPNIFVRVEI